MRTIAYTLTAWLLTSVVLGLVLGYFMDKNDPTTPQWPWERER